MMKTRLCSSAKLAVVISAISLLLQITATAQDGTPRTGGYNIHIYPTFTGAAALPPPGTPLNYNGGPVMQTNVNTYAIFWVPPKLQNGNPTSMTAHYQGVLKNMLADYPGHGIDNNNTQYFQIVGGATQYIQNKGGLAGFFVDTSAYPASGCSDGATPGNCITDAQVQAEITKVMTAKGWSGGLNKMFLLFTSSGEGSCFDSSSTSCAYVQYCAYHSFFGPTATPTVYGNEPFGNTSVCQAPGVPSPNGDPLADTAATAASHELTEATTDPELDAWFDSSGAEIGDKCAYNYGTNTWDSAKANQMWNGHFYELQMEYDNHASGCVQVGP
jgi:hypothetical protein